MNIFISILLIYFSLSIYKRFKDSLKCKHVSTSIIKKNLFSFTSPRDSQKITTWTDTCDRCKEEIFFTKGLVEGEPDYIISTKLSK